MQVHEFRFLTPYEPFIDLRFINWSRCYEWGYVLNVIRNYPYAKIHNTCAGPGQIHKQFHDSLVAINKNIVNSDLIETDINKHFLNFRRYNILDPLEEKFDIVLCISTLEELSDKDTNIPRAFNNLINQLNKGGRLIITCDYPDVDLKILENLIGRRCEDVRVRLNGNNSIYPQPEYSRLNIILIDLEV